MCKSWQGPEKQMFSKFLDLQFLKTLTSSNVVNDEQLGLVQNICSIPMFKPTIVHSSVEQTSSEGDIVSIQRSYYTCDVSQIDATEKNYQTQWRSQGGGLGVLKPPHWLQVQYIYM